ncbi:MAG: radical SAM protein [Armatimonadetes bacterium]|nr:radical SAM protein [Armatimonadota bacterium]
MKAALINPRAPGGNARNQILMEVWNKIAGRGSYTYAQYREHILEWMPSLGLLSIAAYFDEADSVAYFEEDMEPLPAAGAHDLVCLQALNNQGPRAYEIARHFQGRGVPTVLGGFHASTLPEEACRHVQSVVVGEGEDTFPRYLEDLRAGHPQPLYRSMRNADLTRVPPPRFDLVKHLMGDAGFTKIPLYATRGCPHHCEFCCIIRVYGQRHRHKTVEQIVAEIRLIKALYGDVYLSFADENMFIDRRFARELLRALIPLDVMWEGYSDVAIGYDPSILELLPRAGCCQLFVGLESVQAANLQQIDAFKSRQGHKYHDLVRRIQSYGVTVMGLFVVGLDDDDEGTFVRLRDFILDCGMFDVDFSLLCPIPGTPLFERFEREGRLLSKDWNDYDWYSVTFAPRKLSPERLDEGIRWLFEETYQPWMVEQRLAFFEAVKRRSPQRFKLTVLGGERREYYNGAEMTVAG